MQIEKEKDMMQKETLTHDLAAVNKAGLYAGKRLLLVEHNGLNREIEAVLLRYTGAAVDTVSGGLEAVKAFSGAAPDTYHMIFMELQMPGFGGLEAAVSIRSLERPDARQIPIIALTGSAGGEAARAAVEAGVNECLQTPLNTACLNEVLARYIHF